MLKRIDYYIIKKFLGTYLLSILMIISIAIIIDITEKMDNFYNEGLDFKTILTEYYIYFIPYYSNMFSSLFTFISVIFVTSKLAFNSEIIAMLAGGISLRRIIVPYMISAGLICSLTLYISSDVIPPGIHERLKFESKHIDHSAFESSAENRQLKISDSTTVYLERFDIHKGIGYRFSYDFFDGKNLKKRITADRIHYDTAYNWTAIRYQIRTFTNLKEEFSQGDSLKIAINMEPDDFKVVIKQYEQLTTAELREYISKQTSRGLSGLNAYKLELHKRIAMPFSSFILTLIGVSLAYKKVRGGTGYHLLLGLMLSVIYILSTFISSSLTIKGGVNPALAIWTPNIVFSIIALGLYYKASK